MSVCFKLRNEAWVKDAILQIISLLFLFLLFGQKAQGHPNAPDGIEEVRSLKALFPEFIRPKFAAFFTNNASFAPPCLDGVGEVKIKTTTKEYLSKSFETEKTREGAPLWYQQLAFTKLQKHAGILETRENEASNALQMPVTFGLILSSDVWQGNFVKYSPGLSPDELGPAGFRKRCGGQYVGGFRVQASSFLRFKIQFANQLAKHQFVALHPTRLLGLEDFAAHLDAYKRDFPGQIQVKTSLFQVGGSQRVKESIYRRMQACMANGACSSLAQDYRSYLLSQDGFYRDVRQAWDLRGQFFRVANLSAISLRAYPGVASEGEAFPEEINSRNKLAKLFNQALFNWQHSLELLAEDQSPTDQKKIQVYSAGMLASLKLISLQLKKCSVDLSQCPLAADELQIYLEAHPLRRLQNPSRFYSYCQARHRLSAHDQKLIEHLMLAYQQADCEKLQLDLESASHLHLKNLGLKDIHILKDLSNLRSLDLRGNQIQSLAKVWGLDGLEELILHNNPIAASAERDFFPGSLIITDHELCAFERKRLLSLKAISVYDYKLYSEAKMGPVYSQAGQIIGWQYCHPGLALQIP